MLTQAPLPAWRDLAASIVPSTPGSSDLSRAWLGDNAVAGWLSRSAWSLALIAQWREARTGKPVVVWVPDFFCNASLLALRVTGAQLVFYPVREDLTPDPALLREMASATPPDVVLQVHYFGKPLVAPILRELCAQHRAWLVEDAVHVLRPITGVGDIGDFVLYSPHKHLPIPDGAVLVIGSGGPTKLTPEDITSFGAPESWPGQLSALHQRMDPASRRASGTGGWLGKRVVQRLGAGALQRTGAPFPEPSDGEPQVPLPPPQQTTLSRRILARLSASLGAEARARQRRQLLWDEVLLDDEAGVKAADRPHHREWVPYLAAYSLDGAAERVYGDWAERGLPVSTWPDMPPEVKANRERHAVAWRLRHSRVYVATHGSLGVRTMLRRARRAPARVGVADVRVEWDVASRAQWKVWLSEAGRTNLLQSWAYGDAKAVSAGWTVSRGVIHKGESPLAIVQALRKRVAGAFTVVRINRGPLALRTLSCEEQRAVLLAMRDLGGAARGRVLSIAPEILLSGRALHVMEELGFHSLSRAGAESLWMDLSQDTAAHAASLRGPWRKVLKDLEAPERKGLTLEITTDSESFEWLMTKYAELMSDRDFAGPSIALLRSLREAMGSEESLIVIRARYDGEPVSAICLATHGRAATYLIGWNGPTGRKLGANKPLLWNAMKHLKERGFEWFDLGGLDEEAAPGIAAFKLALGGERYELVGEYLRW